MKSFDWVSSQNVVRKQIKYVLLIRSCIQFGSDVNKILFKTLRLILFVGFDGHYFFSIFCAVICDKETHITVRFWDNTDGFLARRVG